MPANVDPVAVMIDGACDPAHVRAHFENDWLHAGPFEQFECGCEPRGPGADDSGRLLRHPSSLKIVKACMTAATREILRRNLRQVYPRFRNRSGNQSMDGTPQTGS